jgi:peptidoglycan/LPS O-acetylase OafA/YrhL
VLQRSPQSDFPAPALPRAVTTTDLWKAAAIVLVLVDHYGLYFVAEPAPWRLAGRLAAPVFFFLIGFARTGRAPWSWIVLAGLLTGVRMLTEPGPGDQFANILLSFALLRLVILPAVRPCVMPRAWGVAALILASTALIPWTKPFLEYGTEGWLWAFFGLAQRLAGESGDPRIVWARNTLALSAGTAWVIAETANFAFGPMQATILAVLIGALVLALGRFRRELLVYQPPEPMAAILRFAGRWTLEIYAVTLFGMHVLAYGIAKGWV